MESKLQIISGRFRGRKLRLPADARPTQNRARIALFNMLESGLFDFNRQFTVWDSFAGSGALGIECLSRYCGARVIFTDISLSSVNTIRANLAILRSDVNAQVVLSDAMPAIKTYGATADLVFIDAPYAEHDTGSAFVRKLGTVARLGTLVVWEQDTATPHEPSEDTWEILRDKRYGRARFLILRRK